ncbi:MAG TPA: response regulator transcription factor [Coriobacteriia bacterium]|jgi:DNA-binding response OmpR family regulator
MHMKRVLLASDDAHTRGWLRHALLGLDVAIVEAHLNELQSNLAKGEFDLVVLDGARNPDVLTQVVENANASGQEIALFLVIEQEVLAQLRLPIRLTSDFMVRGAASEEVAARVRQLLWPGEEASAQELIRIDELTVNLATYQAHVEGEPIDFTYMEYALFTFLVTHPNRAYSREVLLRRVWGSEYYGGSRTVDVHVRRIRAKIGAELSSRLVTVRHVGYLWRST